MCAAKQNHFSFTDFEVTESCERKIYSPCVLKLTECISSGSRMSLFTAFNGFLTTTACEAGRQKENQEQWLLIVCNRLVD